MPEQRLSGKNFFRRAFSVFFLVLIISHICYANALAYMALCVKLAIASQGITVTLPSQFQPPMPRIPRPPPQVQVPPHAPPLLPQVQPTSPPNSGKPPQQELPSGQAGGAPISVINFTQPSQMPASTPVKPLPDKPPDFVKIVTVWPI